MNIIPYPKKISESSTEIKYRAIKEKPAVGDARVEKAIGKLPYSPSGAELEINISGNSGEEYKLRLEENRVRIDAQSAAGAFYAVQTLRQIFENKRVFCAEIEDGPDFAVRGFYHDITRGKVPKIETLKRLADEMAYYKLNSLQLYVEHTFEFKEFADSIERTGYISAEELKELDSYCADNFIEFVPSLATFGHLYELLEKDSHRHLAEAKADNTIAWANRMAHHTIDPTREESFELIKSLIDQYIACFTSDKLNICCDETFDLKRGRHRDADTAKLYADFVCKIIDYVKSRGKTVMMWADILLQHPGEISRIPEDTVLLNWDYEPDVTEDKVKKIAALGRRQMVCPGTSTWYKLSENVRAATPNIIKMTEYGCKYGAVGVLNTNWGDWGNPCSIELSMHGMVLGAEKSWNVSADNNYDERMNEILYKNPRAAEYLERLSDIQEVTRWQTAAELYINLIRNAGYSVKYPSKEELEGAIGGCFSLIGEINADNWERTEYKEELLLAAEGSAVIGEILAAYAGYGIARRTDTGQWLAKFSQMWRRKNKESELCEIQKMFETLESCIIQGGCGA